MTLFEKFPKIARLSREVIISEKIDGTNGCICIGEDGEFLVGSRTQWITPEKDNFGFAKWAYEHKEELMQLGRGRHFGEWWGSGIQRGYGLPKGEKRFSLFNTIRWCMYNEEPKVISVNEKGEARIQSVAPACCHIVPIFYRVLFMSYVVEDCLTWLTLNGSQASPGFMRPEGVVVYHIAGDVAFKKTIEKDEGKKEDKQKKAVGQKVKDDKSDRY